MSNKTVSALIEVRSSDKVYSFFEAIYEKFSKWLKEDLGDEYDFKLSSNGELMSIIMERKDGYHREIVTAKPMGRCLMIETFSPLILFLVSDIVEKIPKDEYRTSHRKEKQQMKLELLLSEPCGKGGNYGKIFHEV